MPSGQVTGPYVRMILPALDFVRVKVIDDGIGCEIPNDGAYRWSEGVGHDSQVGELIGTDI
jgi:hypothetical protein